MADINQVITLGIGTPASIAYFIRFGLGAGAVLPTPASRTNYISAESRTHIVPADIRVRQIPAEDRSDDTTLQ